MGFRQPSDALSDVAPSTRRHEQKHVDRQARRVQVGIPISGDPGRYGQRRGGPPALAAIPAIVVTAITQGSGATPGTGAVQLYYLDTPDDAAATADADNDDVPVLNWYTGSGTIAVGKHVFVSAWSGGYWLVACDC